MIKDCMGNIKKMLEYAHIASPGRNINDPEV